ncbi:hypothetical protein [Acidisoma cladoniae]|jgi:hypothetical protein|uniref:hypothetical protein n=1 Tax=Acidisoma cladoniae TaxID=3040935 RepID=UPI00254ECDB7|nr:hypothetical protein [Acidisoma sp. PAMC 29798]
MAGRRYRYNRIGIKLTHIDEVGNRATIQVSGYHYCIGNCSHTRDRLLVSAYQAQGRNAVSVPTSATIDLPSDDSEISSTIVLPIDGQITLYPFDTYALRIGVAVERTQTDAQGQTRSFIDSSGQKGSLMLSFSETIPRLDASAPRAVDPVQATPARAPYRYASAFEVTLSRPLYTKVVVVVLVGLILMASVLVVLLTTFHDLVLNIGATILGIWGARALLLGEFPPDTTLIDLILLGTIVFVMLGVGVKSLYYFGHAFRRRKNDR